MSEQTKDCAECARLDLLDALRSAMNTARERLEQQIASARTYTYIDLHGNRTAKERKR